MGCAAEAPQLQQMSTSSLGSSGTALHRMSGASQGSHWDPSLQLLPAHALPAAGHGVAALPGQLPDVLSHQDMQHLHVSQ